MKLTTLVVRGLRTPGKYSDGHGLFLHVMAGKDGAAPVKRYWMFRFQRGGKERVMSFGSAEVIMLGEARRRHTEARAMLARGLDPLAERERAKPQPTRSFAEVVEDYVQAHQAGWRGERAASTWRQSLVAHAVPVFGRKAVADVDRDDVLKAVQAIWFEKPVMATIVRNRIEMVLAYAKARGWREGPNPAAWRDGLRDLLPAHRKVHKVVHRAALGWREAPALMARLSSRDGVPALALRFLILTAVRSAEARGARWSEIDMDTATWTIPAARMKGGRQPHRVPLSDPALAILRELAAVRSDDLVFVGRRPGRPVSDVAVKAVLRRLGHGAVTVHGFRSSFRDWAADTDKLADAAEAALAHTPVVVVRSYQRSDLLDPRRPLMEAWAAFLTGATGVVVTLPTRAA